MKSTGIVRRIDDLGRIIIPKDLRRQLDIKEGDPFEICIEGNSVVFTKYDVAHDIRVALEGVYRMVRDNTDISTDTAVEVMNKLNEAIKLLGDKK